MVSMKLQRFSLVLVLVLGGCALPGYENGRPQPVVVERGSPYPEGSPYESPRREEPADTGEQSSGKGDGESGAIRTAPATRPEGGRQLPAAAVALMAQARDHRAAGRLSDAAVTLERALRIAPREPSIYRELAEVRLQEGKTAQAEQFARKGISLAGGEDAEQARLWTVVAECRWAAKDSEGALAAEQKAKELRGRGWSFW